MFYFARVCTEAMQLSCRWALMDYAKFDDIFSIRGSRDLVSCLCGRIRDLTVCLYFFFWRFSFCLSGLVDKTI